MISTVSRFHHWETTSWSVVCNIVTHYISISVTCILMYTAKNITCICWSWYKNIQGNLNKLTTVIPVFLLCFGIKLCYFKFFRPSQASRLFLDPVTSTNIMKLYGTSYWTTCNGYFVPQNRNMNFRSQTTLGHHAPVNKSHRRLQLPMFMMFDQSWVVAVFATFFFLLSGITGPFIHSST